jgi:preprotein translocase subunit SecE
MSKEKSASNMGMNVLLQEFTSFTWYKRSQGKLARQITMATIWTVVFLGCWTLYEALKAQPQYLQMGVPGALLLIGGWIGYRLVNYPPFADFLIAVEAEMNKVSWPTWRELSRSTIVVIVLIVGLTAILFSLDTLWLFILTALGVAKG